MFYTYEYRWYPEGRNFAFLQRKRDNIYNPYVHLRDDIFVTPTVADTGAIIVRYTVAVSAPADVTSDLGVSEDIAMGVVHYVKYKLLEDGGDTRKRDWHYRRFLYYINKHNKNLKGEPTKTIPDGVEVVK